jgi:hypothetical protein
MLKPVFQLAAVGVLGVVVWKVLSIFMLPLLGILLKVALLVGVVFLVMWLLRKPKDEPTKDEEAPAT